MWGTCGTVTLTWLNKAGQLQVGLCFCLSYCCRAESDLRGRQCLCSKIPCTGYAIRGLTRLPQTFMHDEG